MGRKLINLKLAGVPNDTTKRLLVAILNSKMADDGKSLRIIIILLPFHVKDIPLKYDVKSNFAVCDFIKIV